MHKGLQVVNHYRFRRTFRLTRRYNMISTIGMTHAFLSTLFPKIRSSIASLMWRLSCWSALRPHPYWLHASYHLPDVPCRLPESPLTICLKAPLICLYVGIEQKYFSSPRNLASRMRIFSAGWRLRVTRRIVLIVASSSCFDVDFFILVGALLNKTEILC